VIGTWKGKQMAEQDRSTNAAGPDETQGERAEDQAPHTDVLDHLQKTIDEAKQAADEALDPQRE
jgi:hypothetical protein